MALQCPATKTQHFILRQDRFQSAHKFEGIKRHEHNIIKRHKLVLCTAAKHEEPARKTIGPRILRPSPGMN